MLIDYQCLIKMKKLIKYSYFNQSCHPTINIMNYKPQSMQICMHTSKVIKLYIKLLVFCILKLIEHESKHINMY